MLDDRGKTAAYLLYSLTRIRSIVRQTGVDTAPMKTPAFDQLDLAHPKEVKLAKQLIRCQTEKTVVLLYLSLNSY